MTSLPVTTRAMEENESLADPYFDTARCVRRLLATYAKYGNLLVSCDFDDTVYDWHERGHTFPAVLDLLLECQALGFPITIFTASDPSRYPLITSHMEGHGVRLASINTNPIPLPYGNHGKVFYSILLCDRAGLFQAYETLRRAVTLIKGSLALRAAGDEVGAEAVLTRGSV